MMDINDFIKKVEDEIEEIEPGSLKPETLFKETQEWSSMHALILIALINVEYDVTITGEDLRGCKTIQDLFDIVKSRL